jgi:uncharacterized membrane protein YfcA
VETFVSLLGPELLLMAVSVVAAGLLRGFSGFGAGLIMVPALALLVGPALAVPLAVLLDLVAGLQLLPPAMGQVRWSTVAPLGLAACVTIPLGSTILARLDASSLQRIISVAVLVSVAILWTGWRYHGKPSTLQSGATGALSGLLTGMAGIGGPPVILLFHSGRDSAPAIRASLIGYFAISQAIALIAYLFNGLLSAQVWMLGLLLTPVFLSSTWFGARMFGRVDEARFRQVSLALLAALAIVGLI